MIVAACPELLIECPDHSRSSQSALENDCKLQRASTCKSQSYERVPYRGLERTYGRQQPIGRRPVALRRHSVFRARGCKDRSTVTGAVRLPFAAAVHARESTQISQEHHLRVARR